MNIIIYCRMECRNEWYKKAFKAYLHEQLQDLQDRGYLDKI
jgi:hypothetical protein